MRHQLSQLYKKRSHLSGLISKTVLTSSNESAQLNSNSGIQIRTIIHAHYAPVAPRPPPRQYEPDGSLRRYKTNAVFYDHGVEWVRWHYRAIGVFHMEYQGETSNEQGPRAAYREQFRWWAQFIPIMTIGCFVGGIVTSFGAMGICPQMYTVDWMEAARERDRAENSYPFTRYLDRRRKERGPHWMLSNLTPTGPNWAWQGGQRDTAYLRARGRSEYVALKARKLWLEQEERKKRLAEEDRELEESFRDEAADTLTVDDDSENDDSGSLLSSDEDEGEE